MRSTRSRSGADVAPVAPARTIFRHRSLLRPCCKSRGGISIPGGVHRPVRSGSRSSWFLTAEEYGVDPWEPRGANSWRGAAAGSVRRRAIGGRNEDPYALALAAYTTAGPGCEVAGITTVCLAVCGNASNTSSTCATAGRESSAVSVFAQSTRTLALRQAQDRLPLADPPQAQTGLPAFR